MQPEVKDGEDATESCTGWLAKAVPTSSDIFVVAFVSFFFSFFSFLFVFLFFFLFALPPFLLPTLGNGVVGLHPKP